MKLKLNRSGVFSLSSHGFVLSRVSRSALCFALGATTVQAQEEAQGEPSVQSGSANSATGTVSSTSYQGASTGAPISFGDMNSYLPSSSQPRMDGKSDSFDLNRGDGRSSIILSGAGAEEGLYGGDGTVSVSKPRGPIPEFHIVKKGDTLWQISTNYYQNPWEWPRLWSMNPQVENPHWIYPGDQLRTGAKSATMAEARFSDDNSAGGGGLVGRQAIVPTGTVFLRDQGYIGDPERDIWGELVGAKEEKMLLSDQDTVYLLLKEDVEVRLGQRLTLFQEVRSPSGVDGARKPPGELVKIYGTVRIDGWDPDSRIAKGKLIESLDVVERGTKVGPVGRRFDVVPPKRSTVDLEARVLTSVYPHIYFAQNQVVFIDKGSEDGLIPGNRMRVIRRGDTWRRELKSGASHARLRVPLDSPEEAPALNTPLRGDDERFPDEVVGEVMVLRTEQYSSVCLVIETNRPLEVGDRLVATNGY